ncbi:uncharacterized protein LOC118516517, partial [Anopheles stephensi]|uniref:uncharacterized protein LOC118516517 n=1 Tax=Anopheles stephensi TaxID=30069 RepID=UPI00165872B4
MTVANLLISISFLVDGRSRLLLNSLGLIVLLNSFLSLSVIVPRAGVPKIYIYFQWSLVFYALSSILFVIELWLKRNACKHIARFLDCANYKLPGITVCTRKDQRS